MRLKLDNKLNIKSYNEGEIVRRRKRKENNEIINCRSVRWRHNSIISIKSDRSCKNDDNKNFKKVVIEMREEKDIIKLLKNKIKIVKKIIIL